MAEVTIVGAGLAGSEAAWQIARAGVNVTLIEMRPEHMTSAHQTSLCSELVCSNSLRGEGLHNAVGLLKEELRQLDSLIIEAADHSRVPAGGALAVDRVQFSQYIHNCITTHPRINYLVQEIQTIPEYSINKPTIIASGPLTSSQLADSIQELTGKGHLAFYDAISPIILFDSINMDIAFKQSRYDKGGNDYLNLPLYKNEYYEFINTLGAAERVQLHNDIDSEAIRPFEGCMPIEDMLDRGPETLTFGPMKPVGLTDPRTGSRPYAVVQLRRDDQQGNLWSMVGFQTRLKHPEQERVFRMLPGLEQAEFVRLGSVHRNTFLDSPTCLDSTLEFRNKPGLLFGGQITGVEGYVESTASGFAAGVNAARLALGNSPLSFPSETAIGSLLDYVSNSDRKDFQPMNISFGLMQSYTNYVPAGGKRIGKKDKRNLVATQSLEILNTFANSLMANDLKDC